MVTIELNIFAVLEAVLIIVAALTIQRESYYGFLAPKPLDAAFEGLISTSCGSGKLGISILL
jgi:hypothetical protein